VIKVRLYNLDDEHNRVIGVYEFPVVPRVGETVRFNDGSSRSGFWLVKEVVYDVVVHDGYTATTHFEGATVKVKNVTQEGKK
jgi:hypothetical protein